jgi:CheY-like chemotaxis protein
MDKKIECQLVDDGFNVDHDASEPGKDNRGDENEKHLILLVEDEGEVRTLIRQSLEPYYRVLEAKDGREGIQTARKHIPDLIVSDIRMPEADGYQLCQTLKKDIKTCHIPIILLTAKASDDSILQGLETGADDYVTKPFNAKMLLSRIKNLVELRRQMQLKIQRQRMLLPHEIPVSSVDEEFMKELQAMIEKNMSDPEFKIEQLTKKLLMGRSTLYRKIQALTGEPAKQFLQSYRLERGAQLLKKDFGNVSQVAMEVGFSSPAYFAKCFKERFHQSPSDFVASEVKFS